MYIFAALYRRGRETRPQQYPTNRNNVINFIAAAELCAAAFLMYCILLCKCKIVRIAVLYGIARKVLDETGFLL